MKLIERQKLDKSSNLHSLKIYIYGMMTQMPKNYALLILLLNQSLIRKFRGAKDDCLEVIK